MNENSHENGDIWIYQIETPCTFQPQSIITWTKFKYKLIEIKQTWQQLQQNIIQNLGYPKWGYQQNATVTDVLHDKSFVNASPTTWHQMVYSNFPLNLLNILVYVILHIHILGLSILVSVIREFTRRTCFVAEGDNIVIAFGASIFDVFWRTI